MNKKVVSTICAASLVAGTGLAGLLPTSGTNGRALARGREHAPGKTGAKGISVEAAAQVRRTMTRELNIPATLRAYEQADLFAKTSGYVAEVHVDIGSRVERGDVLLQISVPEMEDELRQAEAVLRAKDAKVRAL